MLLLENGKAPSFEVFAKSRQEKKEEEELEGQDELATPKKVQVCSQSHNWKKMYKQSTTSVKSQQQVAAAEKSGVQ